MITAFPNYPLGKIYKPYKLSLFKKEIKNNIKITRLFIFPSHSKSLYLRFINYISFSISSFIYCFFLVKKSDILYVYQPPPTLGICASIIKIFKRNKIVLDIQDLWPETLIQNKILKNKFLIYLISKLCSFSYFNSDHILTNSYGFKEILIGKGIPNKKISTIYNWSCLETIKHKKYNFNLPIGLDKYFKIIYAGNIGNGQSLDSVIEAASILFKKKEKINFIFIGDGIELDSLKNKVQIMGIKNVTFLESVPMEKIKPILLQADAFLVHLKDLPIFKITIPSKIQTYLELGKPILAAVNGEALQLVKKSECGYSAIPQNPKSIAKAALKLSKLSIDQMQNINKKSSVFYKKNFSMSNSIKRISRIIKSL